MHIFKNPFNCTTAARDPMNWTINEIRSCSPGELLFTSALLKLNGKNFTGHIKIEHWMTESQNTLSRWEKKYISKLNKIMIDRCRNYVLVWWLPWRRKGNGNIETKSKFIFFHFPFIRPSITITLSIKLQFTELNRIVHNPSHPNNKEKVAHILKLLFHPQLSNTER